MIRPKDITALIDDRIAVDRAVKRAAEDAVRLHRRHNVPLVSWRDGKVVHVDPWEVPIPEVDEDPVDLSMLITLPPEMREPGGGAILGGDDDDAAPERAHHPPS